MILTQDSLVGLKKSYEEDLVPIIEIAEWMGVTRAAVYKFFKKNGVETRKGVAGRREVKCDQCGKLHSVTRSRLRDTKRHFCSDGCYFVYLEDKDSITNRHMQRVARAKVSEVFDLKPENVVHHKDKNHFTTDIENFLVFANQSDHIKYHHQLRQGEVTIVPLWDGANQVTDQNLLKKRAENVSYFKPMPKKANN